MSVEIENTSAIIAGKSMPIPASRIVVFSVLLILLILSVLCSFYLFLQFIYQKQIRSKETNHIIICLVLINFMQAVGELSLTLSFLYLNQVPIERPIYCQFWAFLSAVLYGIGLWSMAVGSIERYLFLFYSFTLKKYRIYLRYIPLSLCFLMPISLYIFLVFFFPCTNNFYYFIFWCGAPCFMSLPLWQVVSWLIDHGIPMGIIVLMNIILTIKVLIHKHRMQQVRLWSKNFRMFFQLISIAILYAICWLPFLISGQVIAYTQNVSGLASILFLEYFVYFPYLPVTLCPFVCLFGLWRDLTIRNPFVLIRNRGRRIVPVDM